MKDDFLNAGYDFEYWYIGNLKTYFGHVKSEVKKGENDEFRFFQNMRQLLDALDQEKSGFVSIIQFPININTENLIKLIDRKTSKIVNIDLNQSLSNFGAYHDSQNYYLSLIKNPRKLIFNLRNKFALRRLSSEGILDKIIKFQTGAKFSDDRSITFDDVFTYLKIKRNPRLIDQNYIVFLDNALPSHPDFLRAGVETISSEIYYDKMNKFFDQLEEAFNCEVVIAAHPKSTYSEQYGSRKIIYSKTASLVKDCQFVINHYSSTMSFACLFKKPILYIYTNEFLDSNNYTLQRIYNRILFQSAYFKMSSINIDQYKGNTNIINSISNQVYENFITDYLLSSKYPMSNFEVVKQFI
ncbi:hypothetical protein GO491_10020 [Flavobacteriaceae bacterium Ap0902]|nr:hypothetical protein [Flavobacteriaceae bacterium Ap0902]